MIGDDFLAAAYKICFLGYRKLGIIAKSVIEKLNFQDTEIILKECYFPDLAEKVEQGRNEGCEVFVAGSANAAYFRSHGLGHLVEIQIDYFDYLVSLQKAVEMGCTHAIIAIYSESVPIDIVLLRKAAGIPVDLIMYTDTSELYSRILSSDADVVIGASLACELASELRRKSVLVYAGEDSVRNSIIQARSLAEELRAEARKVEISQAIIAQSPSGIIVTDESGIITLFNNAARKLTSIFDGRLRGRLLADVIPALSYDTFSGSGETFLSKNHLINGSIIRCTQTRLEYAGQNIGMLVTLLADNSRKKKESSGGSGGFTAKYTWNDSIAFSPAMQEVTGLARQYCSQPYPVMICGEPGTGKNFISQCMHNGSPHAEEPYIIINASVYSSQDVSRVLFGYEDSTSVRPGFFELAGSGTIVIQNLQSATETFNACVLQVLTRKSFYRVGGTVSIPFSAHIITICSKEDRQRIPSDLWEFLSVFTICVPSLSQRHEDIDRLFDMFLMQETNTRRIRLSPGITELIGTYSWPGNLPELSSACRRYAFLIKQSVNPTQNTRHLLLIRAIGEDRLVSDYLDRHPALRSLSASPALSALEDIEFLKQIMHYNDTELCDRLGIARTTLWRIRKKASSSDIPDYEEGD